MNAEITGRQQVYAGKVVTLELQDIRLPDGRHVRQEVVLHSQSVSMVPIDSNGRVLLVRQYRAPAEADLLETPAGSIDEGEDVEEAVQRELQEEIGQRAGRLRRLASFFLAPGYCSEYMHVYLAEDLTESRREADEDEMIEVERLSLEDALDRISMGQIRDVKTVAGLLLYAREARPRS